jgi:hypothetical protein
MPFRAALVGMLLAVATALPVAMRASDLEAGFHAPPPEVRLHAYWWWLNGNVTAEAITRDLEAMKEKGFGGALITDAGGAEQDGNHQVPHGPDFGSSEWRALFRHSLREAARLNMELALNIQSGWNLGGPSIMPADAAKILCWTETMVSGPGKVTVQLPAPESRHGLLGAVAVVAMPDRREDTVGCEVTVSSAHKDFPASKSCDGNPGTFWVSDGTEHVNDLLAWIRLSFDTDRAVSSLVLTGRPQHGPKTLAVFAIGSDGAARWIGEGQSGTDGVCCVALAQPQTVRRLEIRITDAYDSAPVGGRPRNVQVAEIRVEGPGWHWPAFSNANIANWEEKALFRPMAGANHDTSLLLANQTAQEESGTVDPANVIEVSRFVDASGKLT